MEKNSDKTIQMLKIKLGKMTVDERKSYIEKFGLELPNELTDEFILELYRKIKSGLTKNYTKREPEKIQRYKEVGYGLRDLGAENHWVSDVEKSNFKIHRPIIICLPGNGCISSEKANGFCKIVERTMGLNHEADSIAQNTSYDYVDVLGVHYATNNDKQTSGTMNKEEVNNFVERFLMPLCVDDNGKLLDINTISLNFSQITFFSHCYGSVALSEIIHCLSDKLKNLGLSPNNIHSALSNTCQITYSAFTTSTPIPTIRIESLTDSFHKGLDEIYENTYGHKLNGVEIQHDNRGYFRKQPSHNVDFEILHIFSSRLLNLENNRDMSKLIDEHTIEYLGREVDWSITEKSKGAKNANLVSILTGYALSWAVAQTMLSANTNKPFPKTGLKEKLAPALQDIITTYKKEDLMM